MINTERIVEIGIGLQEANDDLGFAFAVERCDAYSEYDVTDNIVNNLDKMIALWLEYYELTKNHYSLTCGTVH